MQRLNLPAIKFRLKNTENHQRIFDVVRKKFVILQPEEWVRQHVVHYLNLYKGYPLSLINVEKQLTVNGLKKRYDIIVHNSHGSIEVLVECKAPHVPISQATFDQIARYNLRANAKFLMVTNGMEHYYCSLDMDHEKYVFLRDIPDFSR